MSTQKLKSNSQETRPESGQEIIFEDNVGMFKGTYYSYYTGEVWVENRISDTVQWDDVDWWLPFPEHQD